MKAWKRHVIIVTLSMVPLTAVVAYLYLTTPVARAIIEAITNASNLIALAYALFIFYLWDRTRVNEE